MVCDVPPISSSGLAEFFEASLHEIIRAPSIYPVRVGLRQDDLFSTGKDCVGSRTRFAPRPAAREISASVRVGNWARKSLYIPQVHPLTPCA